MKNYILAILLISFLVSFKGNQSLKNKDFDIKKLEKSMALIPSDTLIINTNDNKDGRPYSQYQVESLYEYGKVHKINIESFYMGKYEISNLEYQNFVKDKAGNDSNLYKKLTPDTNTWRMENTYNEPYVRLYFRHPSYQDYPVVGITYEQAEAYCDWLTEKYNADKKRKYQKVIFQLPTLEQWLIAAEGKYGFFPWNGFNLQNRKGQWLANFRVVSQANTVRQTIKYKDITGEEIEKEMLITAKDFYSSWSSMNITANVKSYWPNKYGLYNMAGNVEEFVKEKGISKGGSWIDPGYYLRNYVIEKYDINNSASAERGFRIMMKVLEK